MLPSNTTIKKGLIELHLSKNFHIRVEETQGDSQFVQDLTDMVIDPNNPRKNRYGTLQWNPREALLMSRPSENCNQSQDRYPVMPPALVLAHEFGHGMSSMKGFGPVVEAFGPYGSMTFEREAASVHGDAVRDIYEHGWSANVNSPIANWVSAYSLLMDPWGGR